MIVVDLFAGCGGLSEGFRSAGYKVVASLEIDQTCCETLKLNEKQDAGVIFCCDIRKTDDYLPELKKVSAAHGGTDLIVGGPPCQAYSVAGRIRDPDGMRNDYRNYLFESFVENLNALRPKAFLFENVTGMLSAKPGGIPIEDRIAAEFAKSGYEVIKGFKNAVVSMPEFGLPQKRSRVILFGINKRKVAKATDKVANFYSMLNERKSLEKTQTVKDAIGNLPKIMPAGLGGDKPYYEISEAFSEHEPRGHSKRDMQIFKLLAEDIEKKKFRYISTAALKRLYTDKTGKSSKVHKYYVLRWDEPSNTIPAHLYKDGLRHIHPDSSQSRTITVREAARLQGFNDTYRFAGSRTDKYKMIGNAVPPSVAQIFAQIIKELLV